MSTNKRLLYKDLDALRFFAFVPIYISCVLFAVDTKENTFISDIAGISGYIAQNSIDFFFFLSSFLITAQGLREYKYTKRFSVKYFFIRRLIRMLPLMGLLIIFGFIIHPWIHTTLKLTPINFPSIKYFLLMTPNYGGVEISEHFIYLGVLITLYMFMQFYLVWGLVLKFFSQQIKYIAYGLIGIGIAARLYHILLNEPYVFDTLSMGIPIGIGALIANTARKEPRLVDIIKQVEKSTLLIVYGIGIVSILVGYLFLANTYFSVIVPIITSFFFGFVVLEQTYCKHSYIKFRRNKLLSRLGKISYGLIVYSSICIVLCVISVLSLSVELNSLPIQLIIGAVSFLIAWLMADISYNYFERPILSIKSDFKRI
ncbi:acyltransferase family protein [Paracrocinitomix mangrovi]|uniref:acyltransferase family protein n=1 Tax=Paracrocinitomix mangrovi TaxID=2862509 RepID=UPI001C8EFBA6|nr:acyltransferase family protein [Paracrocinitomix mangrovi]UKN03267.1 acyltransferase family protein [Paracrocinitomix mangrovi]